LENERLPPIWLGPQMVFVDESIQHELGYKLTIKQGIYEFC